ncbi:DUF6777 domain-containing protein [Streptomyces sp. NPDC091273]|uniref:DUF6777 domain-containing protein n=1 Tax=Streptomyces sp. NPDC091273 TaxID=3365982 RepID=UPI00382FC936
MPRLATALVAVVAVVALAVVLTRPSGTDNAGGEVFLQPAAASGPDPFTESTVTDAATPPESATEQPPASPTGPKTPNAPASATEGTATGTKSISGSAPGVYGGTRDNASCDVEKQIKALSADPAKNAAFASALGIQPQSVPSYLRSLTSVQLRMDTRVTNHGYQNGKLTSYQAVLEAGTAVLVDDRGVPRVRCACGNPLGPPVALKAAPKRFGQTWPSYQPQKVVVIAPAPTVVHKIVIYDQHSRSWYERDKGSHHGRPDRPVPPPVVPTPTFVPPKPTGTHPRPTGTHPKPTPTGTKTSPKPTEKEPEGVKPTEKEPEGVKPTEKEPEGVKPTEKEPEGVKPTEKELEGVKPTEKELEGVKPTEKELEGVKPTEKELQGVKPTEKELQGVKPTEKELEGVKPTEKEPKPETRTTAADETKPETKPETETEKPADRLTEEHDPADPVEPGNPVPPPADDEEPEVNES